jgi:hypothetical protein
VPQWLQSRGLSRSERLKSALAHWAQSSNGKFV